MPNYSDKYNKSSNRQHAIPNMQLAAGGFTPAAFTPFVYTPKEFDVSPLQKSLATLDERKERTDQQRAAIRTALGKVKLNAAEDKWKNDSVFNYFTRRKDRPYINPKINDMLINVYSDMIDIGINGILNKKYGNFFINFDTIS